jgi:hypothetical protein
MQGGNHWAGAARNGVVHSTRRGHEIRRLPYSGALPHTGVQTPRRLRRWVTGPELPHLAGVRDSAPPWQRPPRAVSRPPDPAPGAGGSFAWPRPGVAIGGGYGRPGLSGCAACGVAGAGRTPAPRCYHRLCRRRGTGLGPGPGRAR